MKRITHLAFANDLMLFSRGDANSVTVLIDVLKSFERSSGHAININKSEIFSAGIKDDLGFMGIPYGTLRVRYLGVPLDAQRLKVENYSPLIDSINKYICTWKGNTLSYVGRLELVCVVIQGVVGY